MNQIKGGLNIGAAIFAILAAFFWLRSTLVKISPSNQPDANGIIPASIESEGADVIATAKRQNTWNKWGACAASIAALLQGVALLLPNQ